MMALPWKLWDKFSSKCSGKTLEQEFSNLAWLHEEKGNFHQSTANLLKEGSDFSLFLGFIFLLL